MSACIFAIFTATKLLYKINNFQIFYYMYVQIILYIYMYRIFKKYVKGILFTFKKKKDHIKYIYVCMYDN